MGKFAGQLIYNYLVKRFINLLLGQIVFSHSPWPSFQPCFRDRRFYCMSWSPCCTLWQSLLHFESECKLNQSLVDFLLSIFTITILLTNLWFAVFFFLFISYLFIYLVLFYQFVCLFYNVFLGCWNKKAFSNSEQPVQTFPRDADEDAQCVSAVLRSLHKTQRVQETTGKSL